MAGSTSPFSEYRSWATGCLGWYYEPNNEAALVGGERMYSSCLVLGDSHVQVFRTIKNGVQDWMFRVCEVGGATAQGAVNPNSSTDALRLFRTHLRSATPASSKCLVVLGEVDCGFVIWYRYAKYGDSIESQLCRSLRNYWSFVRDDVFKYFAPSDVIACSALPPTIRDNTDPRYLNGARADVAASLVERTKLTIEYNLRLKELALQHSCRYLDIFSRTVDPRTGLVADYYRNENPFDHHLSIEKTAPVWIDELTGILLS